MASRRQAARSTATKDKTKRRTTVRSKRELKYLIRRLRNVDAGIARASVVKFVNEQEMSHISFYPARERLWKEWMSTAGIDKVLSFLIAGFSDTLEKHTVGKERFARFLVAWQSFVGTLACSGLSSDQSKVVWESVASGTVSDADRSALVHAVATAVYTFMQKQVSTY